MKVSISQVETILKTLPISYYIKKSATVKLSETAESSSWDPMNEVITISYKQLSVIFDKISSVDNLEEMIRCMLYHETSHAMLTPKHLAVTDIVNIFEDERIETICENYYEKVDFKKFVKLINGFTEDEVYNSAMTLFYAIVRYRRGPENLVKEVDKIIDQYAFLTFANDDDNNCYCYKEAIKKLYLKVADMFDNNTKEELKKKMTSHTNSDINDASELHHHGRKKTTFSADRCAKIVKNITNKYHNDDILQKVEMLLNNIKHASKMTGTAINAYSGIFDARSVARDDYKYFLQKNRQGHAKQFAKLHLNLFIDCSGSFCWSDRIVNEMLYALSQFAKKNRDFSFDMISCGIGQTIRAKDDFIQRSRGGNLLTEDIFDQFKKVQHVDAQNINIVCFDGDAFSDPEYGHYRKEYYKNFKAFDTANTTIISDDANSVAIDSHCKRAKVIYSTSYAKELCKNILYAINRCIR